MKVTVYLPDDLGSQVQQHADLNVSAVAQRALREELSHRETIKRLSGQMARVEVHVPETHNGDVAFVGRELWYRDSQPETTAYLTVKGKIAVHDIDGQSLYVFDSFDELKADPAWRDGESDLVAGVAEALNEKYVVELDI